MTLTHRARSTPSARVAARSLDWPAQRGAIEIEATRLIAARIARVGEQSRRRLVAEHGRPRELVLSAAGRGFPSIRPGRSGSRTAAAGALRKATRDRRAEDVVVGQIAVERFCSCVYRAPTVSFKVSVMEMMLCVKSAQLLLFWFHRSSSRLRSACRVAGSRAMLVKPLPVPNGGAPKFTTPNGGPRFIGSRASKPTSAGAWAPANGRTPACNSRLKQVGVRPAQGCCRDQGRPRNSRRLDSSHSGHNRRRT